MSNVIRFEITMTDEQQKLLDLAGMVSGRAMTNDRLKRIMLNDARRELHNWSNHVVNPPKPNGPVHYSDMPDPSIPPGRPRLNPPKTKLVKPVIVKV